MAAFRVVLDACVLLPQALNNLLLTLADAELFRPVWTPDLLDEVEHNLAGERFGKSPEQAARRIQQMRRTFPFAEEESRGYRELIPAMTNDPKDRHVLAAAVRSGAALIVTANPKDFPPAALDPFDVEAIHPDEFLCDQLDLDSEAVFERIHVLVARNTLPPRTVGELLELLDRLTPRFVDAVRALLVDRDDASDRGAVPAVSALPELTDEQIDSLPPEVRQTYRQIRAVDPAELVRFLGHTDLVNAAWAFLMPVCVDGDLLSVWPNVDPDFRAVLAQKWVRDNHYQMTVDGWDSEAVEAALAGPVPDHPLWVHFERVHLRSFRAMLPDPATWGIGSATRMVAPGVEALYVLDASALEGGLWQPNDPRYVCPVLMHLVDGRWLVRNLGSESDPATTT
ncbi:PIN domain-containing protein [Rhodococcus sp. ACS1]|uniref:Predicted nucleic acid-binding protein, contains PIN domain n=1 Tax=Rhodococcus koreensis TaxID=99653 RepID=A0A1H4TTK5_9NOCA|nr:MULTISPECIES: PIN domain-containing protein [Rhodococcus]PBC46039.1 PIN domain-containing protein [Rhodococcus sp. ACS1]QSE81997.1 PIN domain-containing protein [Rhodococcus koreensis]SEC59832.1 Predicted nucleic acid-binding protein, contains PIN domain [Rhodococcus koreensis]